MATIHRVLTTDEMDSITPEERNALRGYCEPCKLWTPFTRGLSNECCGKCGGDFTNKSGLQITTQRSPMPKSSKAITKYEKIGA